MSAKNREMQQENGVKEQGAFDGMDVPRIRHITGIRIHELTLPESSELETTLSPPSPVQPSIIRRPSNRRHPSGTHLHHIRERSTSASSSTGPGRTRAPTLAGQALEHAHEAVKAIQEQEDQGEVKVKKLARTFLVLRLPTDQADTAASSSTGNGTVLPSSRKGKERAVNGNGHANGRPSLSTSSSQSSVDSFDSSGRSTPTHRPHSSRINPHQPPAKASSDSIPFYISLIHHPSTNPRFLHLEEGDFAPWLTTEESASSEAILEVWYEDHDGDDQNVKWRKANTVGGGGDLRNLRRVEKETKLGENAVLFTLESDTRETYYLDAIPTAPGINATSTAKDAVERSRRETRMKKGVGLGGLHQLVNMQAVIADTQRGIAEVQAEIDKLLRRDIDGRALRRSVDERETRLKWIEEKIHATEKETEEVHAAVTLRRKTLDERRTNLKKSESTDTLLQSQLSDLELDLETAEIDRSSLLPAIHQSRSQHVQALDALFPITPIHANSLLYSIFDIPLPIPLGPKDPAPPLNMNLPENLGKVDEKSTAAALGYVAMLVSVLGGLSGVRKEGGLSYPITCAGSRSLVKDTVSVMQGPRSFPLYAKGVERYRYEYAVFLLNKNIEMLMQEASIKMVDLRHTLPNLKALLLTLSSPTPPPQRRHFSNPNSRMTSRQTSQAYSFQRYSLSPGPGEGDLVSPIKRRTRRSRLSHGSMLGRDDASGEEDGSETETLPRLLMIQL